MKKSSSLRTKLIILMIFIVILQNISLIMSLSLSRVFYRLDAEAFRVFNNVSSGRMQTFNQEIGQLITNTVDEALDLSRDLQKLIRQNNFPTNTSQSLYDQIAINATPHLIHLLQNNSISGAFFILADSPASNLPSVYIRNSTPKTFNTHPENYILEVGPISVSQNFLVPTSVNWNISLPFNLENDELDFYHKPLQAALQFPLAEMERYGYWTKPSHILPDLQSAVYYTLPLLDAKGLPIGVFGIEISLNHFSQYYLPYLDMPYQDSFYTVTQLNNDVLSLDWFISSGPLAHLYLPEDRQLYLDKEPSADNIYTTNLSGLGKVYCFVHPLAIYSRNSPFYDDSWYLVSFSPQKVLHEGSGNLRTIFTISIIGTTLLALISILVLTYVSTRKISGLSKYIAGLNPFENIQFKKTGMKEIDELTDAVESLNQSVVQAYKSTSQILELSLLPIGGFEVNNRTGQVILTEYIYNLLGLDSKNTISEAEWKDHYHNLTASPAQEYENIYQLAHPDEYTKTWLRIIEKPTETGIIGVILDVTKDIEEHRRLIHELDYDSMTHLYNRQSFHREAYTKIQQEPDKIGALIFSDLDNLKYINDTFGHDMGDRLILKASEMFNQFSYYGGIVARISGDEFATYLHGFSSKEEVRRLIRQQFKRNESFILKTPDGVSQRIRSSSGIAWYPDDSKNVHDLLKLADFAMYEAKHKEKGVLFEFNPESYQSKSYLFDNREAIHRLIDEQLIHFCFQPIISLQNGQIYAYEALMRPSLDNFKTPTEILAVAAAQSQLGQLERLVFTTAFAAIDQHLDQLENTYIFINSIPSHSLSLEEFKALEDQYGHLFSKVVIEVTEHESDTIKQMSDRLSAIHQSGIRLAIDDFGNGYSSEARILTVKPDIVKVDMMLIQGIHQNRDKQQLVANLISFCHSKGVLLVAEGVEDQADLSKLIELDMDFVQGYYTGKPALHFQPVPPQIQAEILDIRRRLGRK